MKRQKKNKMNFEDKIEKLAKTAMSDIECLNAICKNESRQIQRTISFIKADINNILGLVWEKMNQDEKDKARKINLK